MYNLLFCIKKSGFIEIFVYFCVDNDVLFNWVVLFDFYFLIKSICLVLDDLFGWYLLICKILKSIGRNLKEMVGIVNEIIIFKYYVFFFCCFVVF